MKIIWYVHNIAYVFLFNSGAVGNRTVFASILYSEVEWSTALVSTTYSGVKWGTVLVSG